MTLSRLVYTFTASIFASNLLFHCFVRDFIEDNGVCTVLNETENVANVHKARLGGVAINYFGFWITILANTDGLFSKLFTRDRCFGIIAIQSVISGNNVNVACILVSLFCPGCALFEYVIKCEYISTDK